MPERALPAIDLAQVVDEGARRAIRGLLTLVEELAIDNRSLRAENQRLRDEINRLKGEQGQPTIKANTRPAPASDHSSEQERHQPRPPAAEPETGADRH